MIPAATPARHHRGFPWARSVPFVGIGAAAGKPSIRMVETYDGRYHLERPLSYCRCLYEACGFNPRIPKKLATMLTLISRLMSSSGLIASLLLRSAVQEGIAKFTSDMAVHATAPKTVLRDAVVVGRRTNVRCTLLVQWQYHHRVGNRMLKIQGCPTAINVRERGY